MKLNINTLTKKQQKVLEDTQSIKNLQGEFDGQYMWVDLPEEIYCKVINS